MPMQVLILTQWFSPEPDFKGLPFVKELAKQGHEVQVLTGFPNYPDGKIYPGYKIRLIHHEILDGFRIIRVPLYPSHDGSSIRRILNYVSFSLSAALLGPFLVKRPDIVYVYHAPGTIALPAMIFKIFRRVPFIYDINDLWPDSLAVSNMLNNRFLLKCVDIWCNMTYRMASHIVVPTKGCKSKLIERGVPESKVDVIYNWCDEAQRHQPRIEHSAVEPDLIDKFNIIFAGTMGKVQGLDAIIDAAKVVAQKEPLVQFVFVGGGVEVERLKQRLAAENIKNCLFLPRRPVTEIGLILNLADVLLVHLIDDPLFEITIPSKIAAYMAVGKPILAAIRGDAAELVQDAKAGICCLPESSQSIASAVLKFYYMTDGERRQMGVNGRQFYDQEISIRVGTQKFERLFRASIASQIGL